MINFKKYTNVGHGNLQPNSSPDKPYNHPLVKNEGEAFKDGGKIMRKSSIDKGTARGLARGMSSGKEAGHIAKDLAKGRATGRMSGYSPAHGLSTGKATGQMKEGRRCHSEGGEVEREYTAKARRMNDDAKPGMKRGGHAHHRDMGGATPGILSARGEQMINRSSGAPLKKGGRAHHRDMGGVIQKALGVSAMPSGGDLKNPVTGMASAGLRNARRLPMQQDASAMPLKHGGHARHEERKHRNGGGSMEGSMKKIFEGGMKASNPAKEDYMKKLHATTRMVSKGVPHAENMRQHPSGRRGR